MRLPALALGLALSVGGTTVTVRDHGPVDLNRVEHGRRMAAVMMIYKVNFPSQGHQIILRDESRGRYLLKVNGAFDTADGVLFYLPAGHTYSIAGIELASSFHHDEFAVVNLPAFPVYPGALTEIPYFELEIEGGQFRARSNLDLQTDRRLWMRQRYGYSGKIIPVRAL